MLRTPTLRLKRTLLVIVALFTWSVIISDAHAAGVNYRGPFEGRVVDQETGQPIEGAVVFVEWHIRHMMIAESFFDAKEVLTDKDGNFFIPKNWSFNPWRNMVMDSDVIIFKAGYGNVQVHWNPVMEGAMILAHLPPEEREKPMAGCRWAVGDVKIFLRCLPPGELKGPGSQFYLRYEANLPVFLLKKLSTKKERYENRIGLTSSDVPNNKKQLLRQEIERDRTLDQTSGDVNP
jgi:hypothetical protein